MKMRTTLTQSARGGVPSSRPKHTRLIVIVAAAAASIICPWVILRHFSGSATCRSSGGEDGSAALEALVLLAQRNAEAIRELTREPGINPSVQSTLDRMLHASSEGGSHTTIKAAEGTLPSSMSDVRSELQQPEGGGSGNGRNSTAVTPSGDIWLRIAIVSVARKNDADYLLRTLHSIVEELPAQPWHPTRRSTDIVVVNNHEPPEAHKIFRRAERAFAGVARFVVKRPGGGGARSCAQAVAGSGRRGRSRVKPSVQRQTCDVAAALGALLELTPVAAHVMILEDDWLLCAGGLLASNVALQRAYAYDPKWLALRVSYGFNGILLRTPDLPSLSAHLANHHDRRPPDHLLFEWFSGERADTKAYATGRCDANARQRDARQRDARQPDVRQRAARQRAACQRAACHRPSVHGVSTERPLSVCAQLVPNLALQHLAPHRPPVDARPADQPVQPAVLLAPV